MKKYNGFTLIELTVTLAIVGALLVLGVPGLKSMIRGNQLVASSNDLVSALHVARSEAIKNNAKVTICESSNGTSCSATGNWENGWIIFNDADGNLSGTGAACVAAGTDCLLRVQKAIPGGQVVIKGLDDISAKITSFTFTSRGIPKDLTMASQAGIFNVCQLDDGGNTVASRAVVLSLSGRVRISDDSAVITQCP